jgi:3-isopropylmalate dehydrogenase
MQCCSVRSVTTGHPRHREHGVRPGNTEEPYAGTGGRIRRGSPDEIALQYSVNTLAGVRRAVA